VLTGAPAEATTAAQGSAIGMYAITISQGTLQSNANYTLQFASGTLTIAPLGTVATPQISPAAGTYTSVQNVTITDSTAGAAIYYTTSGTMPTAGSTQYAGAITVGSTETIEAIAIENGYTNSGVATAVYTINLPPPSFTIAVNSAPQTVSPGGSAQYPITVTAQNGTFPGAVALAASGLPAGATATFSPASVSPGNTSANSLLTVQTAAPMAHLERSGADWPLTAATLPLLGLLIARARRRRWIALCVLMLASVAIASSLDGCTGNSGSNSSPQTYTITVSGVSGTEQQTATLQLTVQ
jgi:hypothetical protein